MGSVRKKAVLIATLILTCILVLGVIWEKNLNRQTAYLVNNQGNTSMYFADYDLLIKGWDKNGITFFFLPAFINIDHIDQSKSVIQIALKDGRELRYPKVNQVQDVLVRDEEGNTVPWKIGVFRSENLNTLDISLNGINYNEVDHYNYSAAAIHIHSPSGRITYQEDEIQIKGRGNGSWPESSDTDKRPFQIKLPEDVSLCGMKNSDKWVLIANATDDTKLRNKLTYDMAYEMEMEYAIESEWVDLYINGEYMGNYLLCHEPDISSGDLDIGSIKPYNNLFFDEDALVETDDKKGFDYQIGIKTVPTGGYLVEKLLEDQYATKKAGFVCNGNYFSIKSPDNASLDEVSYIQSFFSLVDECIHNEGDLEQLRMVDEYSFARQFLISEIGFNADAAIASYYYYKKSDEDILYAGPCWDFDGAYGAWSELKDYTASIVDIYEHRTADIPGGDLQIIPLDWDRLLLQNDVYYKYVKDVFYEYTNVYEEFLSTKIDEYQAKIDKSVYMDCIRWNGYDEKNFLEIQNSYKYLKFYLYNRIEYLSKKYGKRLNLPIPNMKEETIHRIVYLFEDGTRKEMMVPDGTQLRMEDMPSFDRKIYNGWHIYKNGEIHRKVSFYEPVYSDMECVLERYQK